MNLGDAIQELIRANAALDSIGRWEIRDGDYDACVQRTKATKEANDRIEKAKQVIDSWRFS